MHNVARGCLVVTPGMEHYTLPGRGHYPCEQKIWSRLPWAGRGHTGADAQVDADMGGWQVRKDKEKHDSND